ncbi:MAG: hypothetical protein ABS882_09795 [Lysinibacillus sp.]
MEFILIGSLFILQLLSFFWIALLNTKLSKYKDLEKKQQSLIEEMDNSIGAYLVEMKDENDRLIQELKAASMEQTNIKQVVIEDELKHTTLQEELTNPVASLQGDKPAAFTPKKKAANAYGRHQEVHTPGFEQHKVSAILKEVEPQKVPLTFEQKVKNMYDEGQTIEQIAKATNKGKTEIELLLKFSS